MTGFILFFAIIVMVLILFTFVSYYSAKIDEAIEKYNCEEEQYRKAEFSYSLIVEPPIVVRKITEKATEMLEYDFRDFPNLDKKEISKTVNEQANLIARIIVEMDMRAEGWCCFDEEKRILARKVGYYYEQLTSESKEILHELYSPSEICVCLKEGKQAEKDILDAEEDDEKHMAEKKAEEEARNKKATEDFLFWLFINSGNE